MVGRYGPIRSIRFFFEKEYLSQSIGRKMLQKGGPRVQTV